MTKPIADSIIISSITGTKEVDYFGYKLLVEEFVKYIAMDADGSIFGFSEKPEYRGLQWNYEKTEDYELSYIGDLINPNVLPQDTLVTY